MSTLRTRKPTSIPPWPLILLEGGEKVGKTWLALELTGDERVGRSWALDLGEGTLDEYGAIPGADFEIIDHDGTWADIIGQLTAAVEESIEDKAARKPPCVLVVDSGTAEWAMLRAWVDTRARRVPANVRALQKDPDAELVRPRHLWNPVDERHKAFIRLLLRFEGPVIITARGKEISATGPDGQPVAGQKDYRVEGQKDLGYDATAWVRLSRTEPPTVIGVRSVKHGIRPGVDPAKQWPDFTIGALIWDIIGCDPQRSTTRDVRELDADQVMPEEAPPADQDAATLAKAVQLILGSTSLVDAEHWLKVSGDSPLKDRDVAPLLTEQDRENLGMRDGQAVTLLALAQLVVGYCRRHGDDHRCDGNEHVSAHGPRSQPENPGTPIPASNGVVAVAS